MTENEQNSKFDPEKVRSWLDLTEADFIQSLQNRHAYDMLRLQYPDADLRIKMHVLTRDANKEPLSLIVWNPFRKANVIYRFEQGEDGSQRLVEDTLADVKVLEKQFPDLAPEDSSKTVTENSSEQTEDWIKNKQISEEVLGLDDKGRLHLRMDKCSEELERLFRFYTDKRTDELYIYHEDFGVWKADGVQIINKILEAQFRPYLSIRTVDEIVAHIRRHNYIDPSTLTVKNTLLNLRNGVLDLETLQLLPHSPDYYFTNYLDLEWKQNAGVPKKILEFFVDRAGGDDEKFISLCEATAYPAISDYRIHTAIMLVGPTHRGKTTYLELIERIYGKENAAHLSIQQLSLSAKDRPFMLTSLINKTINIADDLPDKPVEYTGLFKQLTGESPIQAERKFGGMISFYNRAKMFFSANKIPVAYETSDAFYGRWLIIEFTRPIQNEKPQEIFMQEIANNEELTNFLPLQVWIAREKLMKNTRFTFSKTPEQNEAIYAKHSNTAKLYCETRLKVNPQGSILKANIFSDYKQWCDKHGYLQETEKSFWSTLKSFFADQESVAERQKTVEGVVKRFYLGLEFVDEGENEEEDESTENTSTKDTDLLKEYFGIGNEQSSQYSQDSQLFVNFNYVKSVYEYIKKFIENPVNPVNPVNQSPEPTQNSNNLLDSQPPEPSSSPAAPQEPAKPTNTPAAPAPDSDAQAQANQQVLSPQPAGPALDSSQKEQTTMLMVSNTTQQEAPAATQEQAPTLSKEEIAQRVFIAVKLSEKYNEPFWSDPELGEPNKKLYAVLQGLTTSVIQEALKSLQWQGYIYETKPNYWRVVKDLHFVDLLAYDNPDVPVYCPNCMKPVTRLYWYDTEWLCVDCLNERQHQNDELYA